jgi:hypothetical protein
MAGKALLRQIFETVRYSTRSMLATFKSNFTKFDVEVSAVLLDQ